MPTEMPLHVFWILGIMAGLVGIVFYILITEFIKEGRDE